MITNKFIYFGNRQLSIISYRHQSKKVSRYKDTIFIPSSSFPRNPTGKKRVENEKRVQKIAKFSSLYSLQENQNRKEQFVLHDGPPYANGNLHIGHALNKILKDITVRFKLLQGYGIRFQPGWDCHGLPIELKASERESRNGKGGGWEDLCPLQKRAKANALATETIRLQMKTFDRWGLMVDWSKIYTTKEPSYVAKEIKLFGELFKKGYIFQSYMPVHFSPSSGTSLAESELEYNEEHISPSLYLALPLNEEETYLGIWTTTPWTLPANAAVCISSDLEYALIQIEFGRRKFNIYWLKERLKDVQGKYNIIRYEKGSKLIGLTYRHPIYNHPCPVIAGNLVSTEKGTGLVHIAPAHGREDFLLALKLGIKTDTQFIDDKGFFKEEAGPKLRHRPVLEEGNNLVIELLESSAKEDSTCAFILNLGSLTHSYPYDWRTKKPTIMRASRQWFFDIDKVKDCAMDLLKNVEIYPEKMRKNFEGLVSNRPYWCLSRQRVWGVPIPVFYHASGEPFINSETIEHICKLILKEGTDVWWRESERVLLPPNYVKQMDAEGKPLPKKGKDILDIWFDSGCSWNCVIGDDKVSDLYLEGIDQTNGWFQSSLLICVAQTGMAPYKSLFMHCFAVDENRQKMSKSKGNVFDPSILTDGGKNHKKDPPWGVNILRLWVSKSTPFKDIPLGEKLINSCESDLVALRSAFWFMLASLNGFKAANKLSFDRLKPIDKYILHKTKFYMDEIWNSYENYKYEDVADKFYNFIVYEIGQHYLNSMKDNLYCGGEDSLSRRSIQSTIHSLLPHLLCSIGPILPHLAEEVALYYPSFCQNGWSVFEEPALSPPSEWVQPVLANKLNFCQSVKNELDRQLLEESLEREEKRKENSFSLCVTISLQNSELESDLRILQSSSDEQHSDLCALLSVANVILRVDPGITEQFQVSKTKCEYSSCLRCRKFTAVYPEELCQRCLGVIREKVL